MQGSRHDSRGQGEPSYMPTIDPGRHGGGTYTAQSTEPTLQDYENVFGPSARDIKTDLQRFKRHGRWHLPDVLKGPNQWLTDRVDGLITDATNSPFTTKILPYKYLANPDAKLKWNTWSFDEGMASRVPYESAARTLTQTKRSFAGYTVRQGLAIVLEHNFMMSDKGRENFKNQLQQLVGSIQYTNDLDVHVALVLAPSYQKTIRERYYVDDKTPTQVCREFVDLFGFVQKNTNALDILIEEAKAQLKSWGGPMPDFLLCNSKLTFQLTMTPEKTNYLTQGIDGVKRLRAGPDITSYRGLSIIHSRSFSMDPGTQPRDILRRRTRVAEYYRVLPNHNNINRQFQFYDEERDTWFTYTFKELLGMARYHNVPGIVGPGLGQGNSNAVSNAYDQLHLNRIDQTAEMVEKAPLLAAEENLMQDGPIEPGQNLGVQLGFDVDTVTSHYDQNLAAKVVAAALNPNSPNWAPGGDFISEDLFFAIGAINWNHFYVGNSKLYPPPPPGAADPLAVQKNAEVVAAAAHLALVPGDARPMGDNVYIPPEKYYFKHMAPNAPGADYGDFETDANNRPYGATECIAYRTELNKTVQPFVKHIVDLAVAAYPHIDLANFNPAAGAATEQLAYAEQSKVMLALLFQSICEYPRKISEFFNPHAGTAVIADLDAAFTLGADTSQAYAESIRFRNYSRYAVAKGLVNTSVNVGGGLGPGAMVPFPYPTECMRSNNTMFTWVHGGITEHTTYLPWNKIQRASHVIPLRRGEPSSSGTMYLSLIHI